MIEITNAGEVDKLAFTLIGASTKNESHIGHFGSGSKYAIAWLLNNNVKFNIYSGLTEIKFELKPVDFRGQTYQQILIDGNETSMSTGMGKDWEPWYIIRELYSNALDEEHGTINLVETPIPCPGYTKIYIDKELFTDVFDNFNRYFIGTHDPIFKSTVGSIHQFGFSNNTVYRKGIKAFNDSHKLLYSYDIDFIDINENRIILNEYQLDMKITEMFSQLEDKEMIADLIHKIVFGQDCYEATMYWKSTAVIAFEK